MFSYYKVKESYFRIGSNPETNEFEVYQDNKNHTDWVKCTVTQIEKPKESSYAYKIKTRDRGGDVLCDSTESKDLRLISTETNNPFDQATTTLSWINEKLLPPALQPSQDKKSTLSCSCLDMRVLGGFAAVLGAFAVALALIALSGVAMGVVVGLGIALFVAGGIGFFAGGRNNGQPPGATHTEVPVVN